MKFSVTSEKVNDILSRKELVVSVDYEGKATPKTTDLVAQLADHFKVPAEKVQAKLFSHVGRSGGYAVVKVWSGDVVKKNKRVKAVVAKPEEQK